MRSLASVSQRSVRRRAGRYALTAVGIALGVAIVFAVLVTSAATDRAFGRFVEGLTGSADVVVTPTGTFDRALPAGIPATLRGDPRVERAVERYGFRSSRELRGEDIDFRRFLQVHGVDLERAGSVHRFVLDAGRLPRPGRPEVLAAPLVDGEVGRRITLATSSGRRPVTVVGRLAEEGAGLADGGRAVYTSIETARRLQGRGEVVNQIDVVLRPGADVEDWIDRTRDRVGEGVVVQPSSELAGLFRDFLTSVQAALTITAAIALFVGALLIFLTFSVAVAERTRFFGTLRALGARPAQVRRLVLGEALLLGSVAGVAGLALGWGLATASLGLVGSLLEIGPVTLRDPWGAAALSVTLGLVMSVGSSLAPARRAASLDPIEAMREPAADGDGPLRPAPRVAVLAAGAVVTWTTDGALLQALGAVLLLLGAALLVPLVLRPAARLCGRATRRLGRGVGDIAVMHLAKERSRSAYTAALLMAVVAATIAIAASNRSMSETLDEVVDQQFGSDLRILAPNHFDAGFGRELRSVEGVERTSAMRFGLTELVSDGQTHETFVSVVDPETYFRVSSFPWVDGDDVSAARALAEGGSVVLADPLADELGVRVGEPVTLRTGEGLRRLTLAGTFAVLGFNEGAVVSIGDATRLLGAARPMAHLVDVSSGRTTGEVRRDIRLRLADRYDFEIETAADVKRFAEEQLSGYFGIGYAVLLVSVVIGILGLANTLAVSVIRRTREIGILRSTGALRGQVRAMVLTESATVVLVAWLLALPLGWALTHATVRAFAASLGFTVDFLWPWALIPPLLASALGAGLVAAAAPARRAARVDPVTAMRFD